MASVFYLINFLIIVVTRQVDPIFLRTGALHFAAERPHPLRRTFLQLTLMDILLSKKLAPGDYVLLEIVTGGCRSTAALTHHGVGLVCLELNSVLQVFDPREGVCHSERVLERDIKEGYNLPRVWLHGCYFQLLSGCALWSQRAPGDGGYSS